MAVARHHGKVHRAAELRPATVYKLIEAADGLRRPERFEKFLLACESDARGRLGLEDRPYPQADILRTALAVVRSVRAEDAGPRVSGHALGQRLRQLRIQAIREALKDSVAGALEALRALQASQLAAEATGSHEELRRMQEEGRDGV